MPHLGVFRPPPDFAAPVPSRDRKERRGQVSDQRLPPQWLRGRMAPHDGVATDARAAHVAANAGLGGRASADRSPLPECKWGRQVTPPPRSSIYGGVVPVDQIESELGNTHIHPPFPLQVTGPEAPVSRVDGDAVQAASTNVSDDRIRVIPCEACGLDSFVKVALGKSPLCLVSTLCLAILGRPNRQIAVLHFLKSPVTCSGTSHPLAQMDSINSPLRGCLACFPSRASNDNDA